MARFLHTGNPLNSDDDSGSDRRDSRMSRHHRKVPDRRVPFCDDEGEEAKPHSTARLSEHKGLHAHHFSASAKKDGRDRRRSWFGVRVSASGDAAFNTAQNSKDAGAHQAPKLVDGSIRQVHNIKECKAGAFKFINGHENTQTGSDYVKDDARNEILGGTPHMPNSIRFRYDDSHFQQQDLEYKSMEELEGYALQKSEQTTNRVQNCLRVAEEIKGDATKTLLSLHEQGEKIRKTHEIAQDIDKDLSRGEKLLGSLGGMFSKTWKPKKGRPISGPAISKNDSYKRREHHLKQRVALGLNGSNSKGQQNLLPRATTRQQTTQDKLEVEKAKQDDMLSALSDTLGELKIMSQDMSAEIGSQLPALKGLDTDIGTLKGRLEGANDRIRRLL